MKKEKQMLEQEREKQQKSKCKQLPSAVRNQPMRSRKEVHVQEMFEELTVSDSESSGDAVCPLCGAVYGDDNELFRICCDGCEWFDLKCTTVKSKHHVPDLYFCASCSYTLQ